MRAVATAFSVSALVLGLAGTAVTAPQSLRPRAARTVEAAAAQRDPYSIEYRLRRSDGAYRWVIETGSPRLAADGSFAGYIGSCSDITDRLRAEERFRQVFEAAPNAMIMIDARGRL